MVFSTIFCDVGSYIVQEFEDSGNPEKHFQDLLVLAKQGIEKGKV